MARKLKIFLADLVHDSLPDRICVPLGIGFIREYLNKLYPFELDISLFKSPGKLMEALGEPQKPEIVGLSNYSWNVRINDWVEKKIAAISNTTVIVKGGPQIRIERPGIEKYLRRNQRVDYYIMYEGEQPMANLVGMFLNEGRVIRPGECETSIPGVAFIKDQNLFYEPICKKDFDLGEIPSPYLSQALDPFLESHYIPLLETNRGCPYNCTFCAWGGERLNGVRKFPYDRVLEEIEYIARRSKANIWYFSDANFGIFSQDIAIARAMQKTVAESKFLRTVSINWAKNSSKYCGEIAGILKDICNPLIAIQSTDKAVLRNVRRSNISIASIKDLVEQGKNRQIGMTTDILAGMPGETFQSHLNTLKDAFDIGFESFNMSQIRMLPGSELENDLSRRKFKLQTKYRLIPAFSGIYDDDPICEYEEVITQTSTLSYKEMSTIRLMHFLCWALWNSKIAQPILRYIYETADCHPIDILMDIITKPGKPAEVVRLIEDYKKEATDEWFDHPEGLIEYFKISHGKSEYLKLNLKYLARLLLEPQTTKSHLDLIAEKSCDNLISEMVDFCMERTFFVETKTSRKKVKYSTLFADVLSSLYQIPHHSDTCRFMVTEKYLKGFNRELDRFEYILNPLRGLTLALQSYSREVVYQFSLS